MELTRFDLKNQAIQERIAVALERIATALETLDVDCQDRRIQAAIKKANALMREELLKNG